MDFKKIFINFALLGLIIFSVLSFIIIFQNDNNAVEKITDNPIINNTYNSLEISLSEAQDTAETQDSIFVNQTPTQSYGEVEITSMISPTKAFKSIILGVYNILIVLPSQILGISPVVTAILSAILIILLIIGIWAIYKGAIS